MLNVQLTASGLPLILAQSENGEWLTVNNQKAAHVKGTRMFRDAAAVGGETTTYRLGGETVSVTATAGMGVVSAGGEFIPCHTLDRFDHLDHDPDTACFNLASGGITVRRPLNPPPLKVSVDLWVGLGEAERVSTFARTGEIFIRAGQTGGRLPAVRLIQAQKITTTSNPKAVLFRVEGHCTHPGGAFYPGLVKPATVAETCRAKISCAGTLKGIVGKINGVVS